MFSRKNLISLPLQIEVSVTASSTAHDSEQRTGTDSGLDARVPIDVDTLAARLRAHGHDVSAALFVDDVAVAAVLGVKPRTVRAWRAAGLGPRAFAFGGSVRYALDDLARFIAENVVTDDAGNAPADRGR
jgi:hypothetical protein